MWLTLLFVIFVVFDPLLLTVGINCSFLHLCKFVRAGFLIFSLVFVSHDFEVGRNVCSEERPLVAYGANFYVFVCRCRFSNLRSVLIVVHATVSPQ